MSQEQNVDTKVENTDAKVAFNLQEAQAKVASAEKVDDLKEVMANVMSFADLIAKESERLVAERDAEKSKLAELEKAKMEAEAASENLKQEVEAVKQVLADLQAAQAAAQAEAKFNQRMAALDETFELADNERALLVEDVKSLDDEAFAKWMEKSMVLMKEKTKSYLAEMKKKDQEKAKIEIEIEDDNEEEDKEEDDKEEEDKEGEGQKGCKATIEKAVNSASASVEPSLLGSPSVEAGKDLRKELQEAFANGITIGGKKLSEIKEKAKK